MQENCTAGTVRGVPDNRHSYRRDFFGSLGKGYLHAQRPFQESDAYQAL
jgi:hypothetical protein